MVTLDYILGGALWIMLGWIMGLRTAKQEHEYWEGWLWFFLVLFAPIVALGKMLYGLFKKYEADKDFEDP